ncbi:MAG TPA: hypothetical protein VNX70_01675 [Bryobacteraceae bacterium]|nr:hypothetical protein [Bryobacteraceae bacterium]
MVAPFKRIKVGCAKIGNRRRTEAAYSAWLEISSGNSFVNELVANGFMAAYIHEKRPAAKEEAARIAADNAA